MSELALITAQGAVGTLTLNRPEARNAFSLELLDALHARIDELGDRTDLSVLVITGAGKSFGAGMDLKAVLDIPGMPTRMLHRLSSLLVKIRALPMVCVASVNGAAIGGGCGLAVACDIAITHADAKLGFPEVDLGVCPAVVSPWLVRKIGAGAARRVLLTGGLMNGTQSTQVGITDHVTESREALDAFVVEHAARLAKGGPAALRSTKNLLNQLDGSLDAGLATQAADLSAKVFESAEALAMLRAKFNAKS
ncbi:MAG: enoyl-CoA hydratase/isomerase family protein [Phycisphaerales bacterium]|nr:enoyl-CoA hydratase/isomerase family protein [Phycisphaerales bacterium]